MSLQEYKLPSLKDKIQEKAVKAVELVDEETDEATEKKPVKKHRRLNK